MGSMRNGMVNESIDIIMMVWWCSGKCSKLYDQWSSVRVPGCNIFNLSNFWITQFQVVANCGATIMLWQIVAPQLCHNSGTERNSASCGKLWQIVANCGAEVEYLEFIIIPIKIVANCGKLWYHSLAPYEIVANCGWLWGTCGILWEVVGEHESTG